MKYILILLFMVLLANALVGHFYEFEDAEFGNKLIGLSVLGFSFLWMPLFIYHRYKNKKVQDYILSDDKIKEMNDFSEKK